MAVNANDAMKHKMKGTNGRFWKINALKNAQSVEKNVLLIYGMAVNVKNAEKYEIQSINGVTANAKNAPQQEMKDTSGHFWKESVKKNVQFVTRCTLLNINGMAANAKGAVKNGM